MEHIIYEIGIEKPEVLGSGSQVSHVERLLDKDAAFGAYRHGRYTYLKRITSHDGTRLTEWWDDEKSTWVR